MLFNIEAWTMRDILKKLSPEEYAGVRAVVITLPEKQDEFFGDLLVDYEGLQKLLTLGGQPAVKAVKGTYSPQKPRDGWASHIESAKNAVHVHVPNIGLLMINEVRVIEDSCTDILQDWLNQGWRIIAVCPPNGTRRPDYVLGRTKLDDR